jgi:hypothetical protein
MSMICVFVKLVQNFEMFHGRTDFRLNPSNGTLEQIMVSEFNSES